MALRESGLERGMRGTMLQALRERRKEIEVFRLRKVTGDGGTGSESDPGQTMYDPRLSFRSSGGGNGNGSGNDRRSNGKRHGIHGAAMRGRYGHGHGHARNMAHTHSHPYPHPGYPTPVGASPGSGSGPGAGADTANLTITANYNKQTLRADPVVANGAVTRHTGYARAGKAEKFGSLI
jgi:hypothetical protein